MRLELCIRHTGGLPLSFLGTRYSADDQGLSESRAVPSLSITSNSALDTASGSGERRQGRQDTGGPGVVLMWCTVLWRTSLATPNGRVRSGISAKILSAGVPIPMVFILGNPVDAVWADIERNVTPSRSLMLRQST